MAQEFFKLVEEFMVNMTSLTTEVFIAYEDKRIAPDKYNKYMEAYDIIFEAKNALQQNTISPTEFVEQLSQASIKVGLYNDIYFTSAFDLITESFNEMCQFITEQSK